MNMEINVSINGHDEPLNQAEARRVKNAVKATVIKEVRNYKNDRSTQPLIQKPQTLQEVPTFLQAFLSTTYGVIIFFMLVFLIAIPASAIGGALFVANQVDAPIYKISDQTDIPKNDTKPQPKEHNEYLIKEAG